ncbi:MAG TPA: hypothetical protein VLV87_10010 [Gammaproteobacteria bacterium]|nr:hypothetical protein [Gammaproteobacteria bacterium]
MTGQDRSRASRLSHEIAWVLLFKLTALSLLWYLFFGPTHVVMVTPAKVSGALFDGPPAKPRS